jgi:hypothetical protein
MANEALVLLLDYGRLGLLRAVILLGQVNKVAAEIEDDLELVDTDFSINEINFVIIFVVFQVVQVVN